VEYVAEFISCIASNATALGVLGAAIAFIWSVLQFFYVRRRDLEAREFEVFHRLVKELVSPDKSDGTMWIDRQAAIVFELRRFKSYHPFTRRMLEGLREKWFADDQFRWPRLIKEIDLTLEFIREKSNPWFKRDRSRA